MRSFKIQVGRLYFYCCNHSLFYDVRLARLEDRCGCWYLRTHRCYCSGSGTNHCYLLPSTASKTVYGEQLIMYDTQYYSYKHACAKLVCDAVSFYISLQVINYALFYFYTIIIIIG